MDVDTAWGIGSATGGFTVVQQSSLVGALLAFSGQQGVWRGKIVDALQGKPGETFRNIVQPSDRQRFNVLQWTRQWSYGVQTLLQFQFTASDHASLR